MLRVLMFWLCMAVPAMADPSFWKFEWPQTDFSITTVENWAQIISGGPGKDGIPALSDPQVIGVAEAQGIGDLEPVIAVEIEGAAPRAYPIRYLMWHEIVNDVVGGRPIAVTFCPLCNSAVTFDRRVGGDVLSFGVTGKLRFSDMVMYDRETQSWWQQAVGQGIVGAQTGVQLAVLPSWMESWAAFKARNPEGEVMAEPAWSRPYGSNPYRRYDTSQRPFLYSGAPPPHGIAPLARVVRVGERAWPLERLRQAERIEEGGVVLEWARGQASALDAGQISAGRDVGNVRVRAEGRDVAHDVMFAFAFDAFWPDGVWMLGE
ncbi:DUF3179 domain-containing protein [Tropicibacter naphthalenivorans]|uniref:DUF3179 domain-containing protein n=1 Tax=Tropicibacter naphthalenivorans TaxID=441103 RepID=A0A0P1GEU3_9RHOB|nr:DUF3179 domain-containing protein [Tropicibacter naphthalenivorans]CUH80223.1 hypothetical protein TRN7648_02880 [Tropicibacter naphthalenivorans]SMC85581.1 Protein of unknown function [Tropicibacter naphthalenivorans]